MRKRVLMIAAAAIFLVGCASRIEVKSVPFTQFDGDLIALVDTDMPAFAYADGNLLPHLDEPDFVALVSGGAAPAMAARAAAPNSVTTWPGAMALSPDGRFAYVVEGRQSPARGVTKIESIEAGLPPGRTLTVVSLERGMVRIVGTAGTAALPTGVAVSPDGRTLAITTEDRAADLQLFPLENGLPAAPINVDLALDIGIGERVGRIEGVAWHPSGHVLAINLGSGGVGFVSLKRQADGRVVGALMQPEPLKFGNLLSGLRWGANGRRLYALDTGWGEGRVSRITNGPGAIHVIDYPEEGAPAVVQSIPTGLSSESFTMSRDGALIATANMERTYLPDSFPAGIIRGRTASSASLFAVDPASGRLTALGDPVFFKGVLPQGIAFDRDARNLAIAVFQDHSANSTEGWIQYMQVVGEGAERRLQPTDRRLVMPRGVHYLVAVPDAE